MVDLSLRSALSQDLRRLVTGRISNDDFDDLFYGRYSSSDDSAVRHLSEYGYGLYSSDLLWPMRLRGHDALTRGERHRAARCVLFLKSGGDYAWPEMPGSKWHGMLWWAALQLGLPTGVILLLYSVPSLLTSVRNREFNLSLALGGGALLIWSVLYLLAHSAFVDEQEHVKWRSWRESGDFDVWPFLRREDFYRARRSVAFLGSAVEAAEIG